MGQRIEIVDTRISGASIIVTTDRSLTGTDGEGFSSADQAAAESTFAAKLASDLFEADTAITRVYVASNVVVLQRDGGWPKETGTLAGRTIEEFFLYY